MHFSAALLATSSADFARLDTKFTYKYDVLADYSVDNYQGDSAGPEVTVRAVVTLSPVASPNLWSLQLFSVKVEGENKKTEILKESDSLFVQFSGEGSSFYVKDSHDHHSKETAHSNLLKSIAHLFQSHSGEKSNDHLGSCSITSDEIDKQTVILKTNCCVDKDLNKHSKHPLGISSNIEREAVYQLDKEETDLVKEIVSRDLIEFHLAGNKDTKSRIESKLHLKLLSREEKSGDDVLEKDFMKNLKKIDKNLFKFPRCDEGHCSKVNYLQRK